MKNIFQEFAGKLKEEVRDKAYEKAYEKGYEGIFADAYAESFMEGYIEELEKSFIRAEEMILDGSISRESAIRCILHGDLFSKWLDSRY